MQKRSLALRASSFRRQERHYSVDDVLRLLNQPVPKSGIRDIKQVLKVLGSISMPIRQLSDIQVENLFYRVYSVLREAGDKLGVADVELLVSICYRQHFLLSDSHCIHLISLIQNNAFCLLDVRFLAYYVDFGGKAISKTQLIQLLPSLSELLCSNRLLPEELYYSLLLLCSHSFHTAAFSSIIDELASYLSELQSHFLSLLPSIFDQSWKNASLILHLLCFILQHTSSLDSPPPHDFSILTSSLLSQITSQYIHSTQPPSSLSHLLSSTLQFFRIVHSMGVKASESDQLLLIQWIYEWEGDVSVRNEALSTIRALLKAENVSENILIPLIRWGTQQIQRESNTEVLRTMQIIAKYIGDSKNELIDVMHTFTFTLLQVAANNLFQSSDVLIALTQIYKVKTRWIAETLSVFPWAKIFSLISDPFQPFEIQKKRTILIATILENYSNEITYMKSENISCREATKQSIIENWGVEAIESISVNQAVCVCYLVPGLLLGAPVSFRDFIGSLLRHHSSQVRLTLLQQLAPAYTNIPEKEFVLDLLMQGVVEEITKNEKDITAIVDAYIIILKEFAPFYRLAPSLILRIFDVFQRMKSRIQVHFLQLLASIPLLDSLSFTDRVIDLFPFALSRDSFVSGEYLALLEKWSFIFTFSQIVTLQHLLQQSRMESNFLPLLLSLCRKAIREKWDGSFIVEWLCEIMAIRSTESFHEVILLLHSLDKESGWKKEDVTKLIDRIEETMEKSSIVLSYLDSVLLDETINKIRSWVIT